MAKRINKDEEITVKSLIRDGNFYYQKGDFEIELEPYDDDFIDFGSLKKMKAKNRKLLETFKILIVDCEDSNVEDVIKELKLEDSYDELKAITGSDNYEFDTDAIAEYVIESDAKDFVKIVKSDKSKVRDLLIREAVYQFKQGKLVDTNKTDAIAESIGIDNKVMISAFWDDIRQSIE